MRSSKTQKMGNHYASAATLITLQDVTAMSEFIRNFKLKYATKRTALAKKKINKY